MSRRRVRRSPSLQVGWVPEMRPLFDLVPSDWTPPEHVVIRGAKAHVTLTARFTTPMGHRSTATLRLAKAIAGDALVLDRGLLLEQRCNFRFEGHC